MNEVTQLLHSIEAGDGTAASRLLPLVYEELRRLAALKLAQEKPGQTLDATGLVHEAYLRLVGPGAQEQWRGRAHFFAAAAEAMRRILIDNARRKKSQKRGGRQDRIDGHDPVAPAGPHQEDLLAIDEALARLEREDAQAALLVKLRFFTGLSMDEAADVMALSRATAYRLWSYSKAWLRTRLSNDHRPLGGPPSRVAEQSHRG
jgi:RNA polymerase sigma factor (TIGR02999 family)